MAPTPNANVDLTSIFIPCKTFWALWFIQIPIILHIISLQNVRIQNTSKVDELKVKVLLAIDGSISRDLARVSLYNNWAVSRWGFQYLSVTRSRSASIPLCGLTSTVYFMKFRPSLCSGGLKPLKNLLRSRLHGHGEFPTLSRDSHLVFLTLDILMSWLLINYS